MNGEQQEHTMAPAGAAGGTAACDDARSLLRTRFPGRDRLFFPVVHIIGRGDAHFTTTLAAVRVAVAGGADGVFLIPAYQTDPGDETVNSTLARVRAEFGRGLFVGINYFVGDVASYIARVPADADAVWHDAGATRASESVGKVGSCQYDPSLPAAARASAEKSWHGLLFAGFFFKGGGHMFLEDEPSQLGDGGDGSPATAYGAETRELAHEAARGLEAACAGAAFRLVYNASGRSNPPLSNQESAREH